MINSTDPFSVCVMVEVGELYIYKLEVRLYQFDNILRGIPPPGDIQSRASDKERGKKKLTRLKHVLSSANLLVISNAALFIY